jgi:cytochrome c peroxidase
VTSGKRPPPRSLLRLLAAPGRRAALILAAFLLAAAGALAQVPSVISGLDLPARREPINPIPPPAPADPRKIALGQQLFADPRLSRDQSTACITCHDVRTNGAGPDSSGPLSSDAMGLFNTPTVFNAAQNFRLNWEGNFRTLEDQAEAALTDQRGMAGSIDADIRILRHNGNVKQQFDMVYGHGPDRETLLDAIATYERSLLTPDSRFDRWLHGDTQALSADAMAGYNLFKSFGCVSCHQGANVGGNLFEQSGIFHRLASPTPEVFRVPSLRNVAVTAPYFHDGSAPTLQDAVRRMGYAQLNRKLSDQQIDLIVAFLDSLTGVYQGRTLTEPP